MYIFGDCPYVKNKRISIVNSTCYQVDETYTCVVVEKDMYSNYLCKETIQPKPNYLRNTYFCELVMIIMLLILIIYEISFISQNYETHWYEKEEIIRCFKGLKGCICLQLRDIDKYYEYVETEMMNDDFIPILKHDNSVVPDEELDN